MDQLNKVLEHKFWIMLGLAIIIPFVGWGMTHSAMVAEFEKGKGELETKFKNIPQGASLPNDRWKTEATTENDKQRLLVESTWKKLWDEQQKAKVWPAKFPSDTDNLDQNTLLLYPQKYRDEVKRIYSVVRPLTPSIMGPTGVIAFPLNQLSVVEWQSSAPPSPRDIREAQEDLWLYEALLKLIDKVNAGVSLQNDAPIPELLTLKLLGGSGGPKGPGAATTSSQPSGMAGMQGMAPIGLSSPLGGADFEDAAGGGQSSGGSVDFSPADEFGPEVDAPVTAGSSSPAPAAPTGATGLAMAPIGLVSPGTGGSGSNAKKDRYVRKTEYWNTRGFYIKVIMDHTEVPRFVAELSNSKEWPIRITRVQTEDVHKEDLAVAGTGSANSPAAGGIPNVSMPMPGGFRPMGGPAAPAGGATRGGNSMVRGGDGEGGTVASTNYDKTKMAYVAVSGEITIYNAPKITGAPATTTPPPAPTTAPPAAVPPVAVAPAATEPATEPAAAPGPTAPAAPGAAPAAPATAGPMPGAAPVSTPSAPAGATTEAVKPGETPPAAGAPTTPAATTPAATTTPATPTSPAAPPTPAATGTTPLPPPAVPGTAPAAVAPAKP